MRKALSVALVICITCLGLVAQVEASAAAPGQDQQYPAPAQDQQAQADALFSPEQLDNLVGPVALYPDPLLAQVLPASTFVDQIDEASRWLRANNDPNGIDQQPWDVSVKSVAHYQSVLYMITSKIDWTTSLGQAYVNQSTDVMTSIQRLRALARSAGNLATNPQQEVITQGPYIQIVPIQPRYIYVPVYDPYAVYYRSGYGFGGGFGGNLISFGTGFAIGAWLNDDFDWGRHRVYYHGWEGSGEGGWVGRSRPNVQINNTYVNNTYTNININRTVINNNVNYTNLNRYGGVHRNVTYNNVAAHARANAGNQVSRGNQGNPVAVNKIIQRNVNTNDPRINAYRGRQPMTAQAKPSGTPQTRQAAPPETRAQAPRNEPLRPAILPTTRPNFSPAVRPAVSTATHPAPMARSAPRPPSPVFSGHTSGFDPRAASQRGQTSRMSASQSRTVAPQQRTVAPQQRSQSRPASPTPAKNPGHSKPERRQ